MDIDHVFMFIEPDGPEIAQLKSIGLVETYRRKHSGQGTANVCFAFENMFVELLWIEDRDEALSPAIVRTGLEARSRWKTAVACPFGIAWRGSKELPFDMWDFAPPYLPSGVTISVANDSDDIHQPMMFTFPGSIAPKHWDKARKGGLQGSAELTSVSSIRLVLPAHVQPCAALKWIEADSEPKMEVQSNKGYGLELGFAGPKRHISWRFGDL
jgi:hypothetical protein